MPINVLFAARPDQWAEYEAPLHAAFAGAGLDVSLSLDAAPEQVEYIVYAPNSDLQDFGPYTRAKAVLSLWAGVETITGNASLTVPLCRMVDPGLTQGMVEWVVGHVMRHHLGMDAHILANPGDWRAVAPPLAQDRPVTILGMGALGAACARALVQLGFPVKGWSRSPKSIKAVTCLNGDAGLDAALDGAQIVVLLLPSTPATENIINAGRFAQMARGSVILNPGRGTLIDDDALLAALDDGRLAHATLDVFRTEPLPAPHPFWAHPKITVTPHIASETRAASASVVIAENIQRGESGLPFLHQVDRTRGY